MANPRYGPDNPPPDLLDAVRQRLAGVCSEWPADLFEQVTLRAAWIEFKYDRAVTDGFAVVKLRELREEQQERSMSA
jgi:hypothetical protein